MPENVSADRGHFRLQPARRTQLADDGDYILRDIGSTNGTRVERQGHRSPSEDHKLQDGDKIIFGKIETSYVSENPGGSAPLPEAEAVVRGRGCDEQTARGFRERLAFPEEEKERRIRVGLVLVILAVLAILAFGGVVAVVYGISSRRPL